MVVQVLGWCREKIPEPLTQILDSKQTGFLQNLNDELLMLFVTWLPVATNPLLSTVLQSAKLALARRHWPVSFLSGQ